MGWIDWIRNALTGFFATVNDAVARIRMALESLHTIIRILGTNVARHWGSLRHHLTQIPSAVLSIIGHGINIGRWLVNTFVPSWARWAMNEAIKLLLKTRDTILAELARVYKFLVKGIDDAVGRLRVFVLDWVNNFRRRVDDTVALLRRVADIVFALLTDPIRLVTWFLPVLVGPLFRFIDSRREAIARWLLDQLLRMIITQAPRIEALLVKLF